MTATSAWPSSRLGTIVDILDARRIPVSASERAKRSGNVPYYGAAGQVGLIDEPLFDEPLVLLGEDGVQFFSPSKSKAYLIQGPAWVNNHAHVLRARGTVDRRFLGHYLNQFDYRGYANGTTRLKLTQAAMKRIPVPLPDISDQRRIADIVDDHLSRLDAAGTYVRAGVGRLTALRRVLLDQRFGLSGLVVPLSTLVSEIQAGRSFGTANAQAGPDEWGIIKVSAMTWGEFRADENKAVAAERVDPRYEINQGDLLVSRANTSDYVGASVLVGPVRRKLLLSDKSLRLIPRPGVNAEWLWRALQAPATRRQISAMATGTKDSMRNISQSSLLQIALHDALPDEQEDAVVRFRALDGSISRLHEELSAAQRRREGLRRALLSAAFCGRLTGAAADVEVIEEVADAHACARAAN